jgi:hypothetical protein
MESDSDRPTPWQALGNVPFVTCIGGLRLGTDFSGIDTPTWAFKVLSVNVDHVFTCEKLPATAKIATHLEVKYKYSDIVDRPDPPDVDLFIFGPPCQSFSKGSKKLGTEDPPNGTLTLRSLQYIVEHKPPMILMEQVPAILQEKHRELMDLVEATFKEAKHVAVGTDVFTTPIIISAGSSDDFAHSEMCIAMTVTKSEATRRGYWCTSKGGFLDADEIALLQGFPRGLIPWRDLKISEPQLCGTIGSGMTLPVIVCLLPSLLFAGGKIDAKTARELQQCAHNFRPVE